MTDQKQEKPKQTQPNWLVKAGGDAILAGGAVGIASFAFGVPAEYAARVALAGSAFSLYISWSHSKHKELPKKKDEKGIPFTTQKGTKYIDRLEYSIEQGGYVLRENYGQALWRKIAKRGSRPVVRPVEQISKPKELSEFIFHSQGLQLRQTHVKLFLNRAWKWRQYGRGLSARQHVRCFSQMPAWFQELSPAWYYAMLSLLKDAGDYCGHHLVVTYENGWRSLIEEPHLTLRILKWAEIEKRKI